MTLRRAFHIISTIDRGGAEKHLLSLVRGLAANGYHSDIAYLKGNGELRSEFAQLGCNVQQVKLHSDVDILAICRLAQLMRDSNYDIVHTHLPHADIHGTLAAMLYPGRALISTKHDYHFLDRRPYRHVHRLLCSRNYAIIAISHFVKTHLIQQGGVPESIIHVIYYGLQGSLPGHGNSNSNVRSDVRAELGIPEDAIVVALVGRLTRQKGVDLLIRAYSRLCEHNSENIWLAIIGRGEEEYHLRRMAWNTSFPSRIRFVGFRTDVDRVMTAFDMLAVPSRWEGLGLVMLEAMRAGLPIVATRVGAIPEIVENDITGFLVSPEADEELAYKLSVLVKRPQLRQRFGERAKTRLQQQFSVQTMVSATCELYDSLLTQEKNHE